MEAIFNKFISPLNLWFGFSFGVWMSPYDWSFYIFIAVQFLAYFVIYKKYRKGINNLKDKISAIPKPKR